jgi:small subunit ribosomal protein S14
MAGQKKRPRAKVPDLFKDREPGGKILAKQALIEKARRTPRFKVRAYNRCNLCGRSRGYMRKFGLCRVCFREVAHKGLIPGVTKSSW